MFRVLLLCSMSHCHVFPRHSNKTERLLMSWVSCDDESKWLLWKGCLYDLCHGGILCYATLQVLSLTLNAPTSDFSATGHTIVFGVILAFLVLFWWPWTRYSIKNSFRSKSDKCRSDPDPLSPLLGVIASLLVVFCLAGLTPLMSSNPHTLFSDVWCYLTFSLLNVSFQPPFFSALSSFCLHVTDCKLYLCLKCLLVIRVMSEEPWHDLLQIHSFRWTLLTSLYFLCSDLC